LFVTRQAVSNWENGKAQPDIETLTVVGAIFGVSLDELARGPKSDAFAQGRRGRSKVTAVLVVVAGFGCGGNWFLSLTFFISGACLRSL